jgi:hypothetical protein
MRYLSIISIIFAAIIVSTAVAQSEMLNSGKISVHIVSPKPGAEISGVIPIKLKVNYSTRDNSSEDSSNYSFNYFVDAKFAGVSTSSGDPFNLDTAKYANAKHLLTVNVIDSQNRIGTTSIWIKVVNDQ